MNYFEESDDDFQRTEDDGPLGCEVCEDIRQQLLEITARMGKSESTRLLHISEVASGFDPSAEPDERQALIRAREHLLKQQEEHQRECHPEG